MSGPNFQKGVKRGNRIVPEGSSNHTGGSTVEELSSPEEVRQAELDGEIVVAELSGRVREKRDGERVLGIDLDNLSQSRKSTWFTDSEIEELESAEGLTRAERKSVQGKSYQEMRDEMRSEIDEIYKQERKEHALKDAQRVENTRDWMKPDYKSEQIQDMDGETFMKAVSEAMAEDSTEEELAQHSDESLEDLLELEPEPEIDTPLTEEEELQAAEAFNQRAKKKGKPAWQDIAEDIEMSNERTKYESTGSNSRKITTEEAQLKEALRDPDSDFDGKITIHQDTGDTVVATVEKGD